MMDCFGNAKWNAVNTKHAVPFLLSPLPSPLHHRQSGWINFWDSYCCHIRQHAFPSSDHYWLSLRKDSGAHALPKFSDCCIDTQSMRMPDSSIMEKKRSPFPKSQRRKSSQKSKFKADNSSTLFSRSISANTMPDWTIIVRFILDPPIQSVSDRRTVFTFNDSATAWITSAEQVSRLNVLSVLLA